MATQLDITINGYVTTELTKRFGYDEKRWVEFIELFLKHRESALLNSSGLPECVECGVYISPEEGYPGKQEPNGDWYHYDCSGESY
jgi:hypothetical protein